MPSPKPAIRSADRDRLDAALAAMVPDLVGLGLLSEEAVFQLPGCIHARELAGFTRLEELGALGELGVRIHSEEDKNDQHERAHRSLQQRIASPANLNGGGGPERCGVCHG